MSAPIIKNVLIDPRHDIQFIDNGIRTWRYKLPLIFFLLYGKELEGTVEARTRAEARAAVKQKYSSHRYPLRRFPVNGILEQVQL